MIIDGDETSIKITKAVNNVCKYREGEVRIVIFEYGDVIDIIESPRERIKSREQPRHRGDKDALGKRTL